MWFQKHGYFWYATVDEALVCDVVKQAQYWRK